MKLCELTSFRELCKSSFISFYYYIYYSYIFLASGRDAFFFAI